VEAVNYITAAARLAVAAVREKAVRQWAALQELDLARVSQPKMRIMSATDPKTDMLETQRDFEF
jgi:hypothetical protein